MRWEPLLAGDHSRDVMVRDQARELDNQVVGEVSRVSSR